MFNKMPIRLRFTLLTAFLLTVCCVGLTFVLNVTAFRVVDRLDAAIITTPAIDGTLSQPVEDNSQTQEMIPLIPSSEASDAKHGFSALSILTMLLVIVGGSAFTYYISAKALRPLNVLNHQVKNMTVQQLSESLEVPSSKDEIAELTASFNEMTGKLNEAFLMQQRFSASAAHELRTPLAVLQAKVDVFKKKPAHTVSEYEELIEVIGKQTSRLRKLVGTLLNMTNMDDDGECTEIPLKEMLADIVTEFSTMAHQKNIRMTLTADGSTVRGMIDLLYRAFYNLIENSLRYNVEGGTVDITVRENAAKQVEILIVDSGPGIDDDAKKHIFEPFYRVDKSRSREMGGAGLGLSIVESVVKRHGGSIRVSDNLMKGTCFQILLDKNNKGPLQTGYRSI